MAEAAAVIRAGDGVIIYTNPSFDHLFGYERGELAGRHVSTINAPVDDETPEERAHQIAQALDKDGAWAGPVHSVRRDGSLLWTEAEVVEVEEPGLGTVWVTVQREVDDHRNEHAALRASEERFRAAFELSPAATVLFDDSARIIDANDAFCRVTGFSRDELIDKPLADVTHPDDAALDIAFIAAVFRGEHESVGRRYMTREGDVVPAMLDASVVRAADGHTLYAVATVTP
jgi:PAS domain S-box-containing protein